MSDSVEDECEKEKNALDIIKNWFTNSPSHGIRRINDATSIVGRIFWSIIFLIFTTLMCFFIYTVIRKYIAQPTKINLTVRQYRDPKYFPSVTFCNLNPLRSVKILEENTAQRSHSVGTDSESQNRFNEYIGSLLADNANRQFPTMMKSGYKLKDILIQCTFNGRLCHENLTPFFHPNYGNCYTFDHEIHVHGSRQNDTPHFWVIDDDNGNDGYKLFLELFLHQNEYISYLDDRAAFRIFIHRQHEIPILSQNSLFVAPTTYTKLIFSQRIISFSQHCRNDLTDDMKQVFSSTHVRYSQALCFKLCEFRSIEKECNCTDRLFLVFFQFFNQNQTKQIKRNNLCSIKDKCWTNRRRLNSIQYCPECLPECELVQYTIQSSYADYPNVRSKEKVLQRIEKYLKSTNSTSYPNTSSYPNASNCLNNCNDFLMDDIVAVGITASPYATEILSESSMYTWVDLISSIGGQTGLWIGVSLISFVEIAELFFLLFCRFIERIYQGLSNQWKQFQQRFLGGRTSTQL